MESTALAFFITECQWLEDVVWLFPRQQQYLEVWRQAPKCTATLLYHLTKQIITGAHSRVQHNGVKDTLSEVRGKFCILKGRSLVKQLIGRCVLCRQFEGLPSAHLQRHHFPDLGCMRHPLHLCGS